jgi:hypothetical protein
MRILEASSDESIGVTLATDTEYHWKVVVYDTSNAAYPDPSYVSRILRFDTLNQAPVVNAGEDIDTWWNGTPRVFQLNGTSSDDGKGPGPNWTRWEVWSEPNATGNPAVISDIEVLDPTITLKEAGLYVVGIRRSDGEHATIDTMDIMVYSDACEHAKNQEGFEYLAGDVSEDCRVDLEDFASLAAAWLEENFTVE